MAYPLGHSLKEACLAVLPLSLSLRDQCSEAGAIQAPNSQGLHQHLGHLLVQEAPLLEDLDSLAAQA